MRDKKQLSSGSDVRDGEKEEGTHDFMEPLIGGFMVTSTLLAQEGKFLNYQPYCWLKQTIDIMNFPPLPLTPLPTSNAPFKKL